MNKLRDIAIFVCAASSLIILFFLITGKPLVTSTNTHEVKTEVIKIYDSTDRKPPQGTLTLISTSFIPVPQDVDTAQILRDYFATYTYTQEVRDSAICANITDVISKNNIVKRDFTYKMLMPQTIKSTTINVKPNYKSFFVGFTIGGNANKFAIGPGVFYETNKRNLIGLTSNLVDKSINLQAFFKIAKRND